MLKQNIIKYFSIFDVDLDVFKASRSYLSMRLPPIMFLCGELGPSFFMIFLMELYFELNHLSHIYMLS